MKLEDSPTYLMKILNNTPIVNDNDNRYVIYVRDVEYSSEHGGILMVWIEVKTKYESLFRHMMGSFRNLTTEYIKKWAFPLLGINPNAVTILVDRYERKRQPIREQKLRDVVKMWLTKNYGDMVRSDETEPDAHKYLTRDGERVFYYLTNVSRVWINDKIREELTLFFGLPEKEARRKVLGFIKSRYPEYSYGDVWWTTFA